MSGLGHVLIGSDQWSLTEPDDPRSLILAPADNSATIADAGALALTGCGYDTAEEAEEAGKLWQSRLIAALASLHLGADFGMRSPGLGGASDHALRLRAEADPDAPRMLNDKHGLLVYEHSPDDPKPMFLAVLPATLRVSPSEERLRPAIEWARQIDGPLAQRVQTAYDLFAGSFVVTVTDARFLELMMAIESLIVREPRDEQARQHVESLIEQTRSSNLPGSEKDSICRGLEDMLEESIGRAGRRLARTLGDRRYIDKKPADFFTDCYRVRSRLAHGDEDRPSSREVGVLAATLEHFVADLITEVITATRN